MLSRNCFTKSHFHKFCPVNVDQHFLNYGQVWSSLDFPQPLRNAKNGPISVSFGPIPSFNHAAGATSGFTDYWSLALRPSFPRAYQKAGLKTAQKVSCNSKCRPFMR
jgi:hypothetical protein